MPHIIVKLASGRSEQRKAALAEAVTNAVMTTLDIEKTAISVAIEDIDPKDWIEAVYKPDIMQNMDRIYRKPGYGPV